jgi:hypothetical protein
MRYTLLVLALVLPAALRGDSAVKSDDKAAKGSQFFNGKNLDGWEGVKEYWSVKDGAIVGYTPKDPGYNNFLCSKKKYGDFELTFKVRLKDGIGNSGVQFRSKLLNPEKYIVGGPQADIGQGFWGSLYGEQFGGMMKQSPSDVVKKVIKQDDFNDYSIRCVGKHVTIKINGETMVDQDFDKEWAAKGENRQELPDEGIIALQLHAGFDSMEVTYKDIKFTELIKK